MIKSGNGGLYFNFTQALYDKPITLTQLTSHSKIFPGSRVRQGCPLMTLVFQLQQLGKKMKFNSIQYERKK